MVRQNQVRATVLLIATLALSACGRQQPAQQANASERVSSDQVEAADREAQQRLAKMLERRAKLIRRSAETEAQDLERQARTIRETLTNAH